MARNNLNTAGTSGLDGALPIGSTADGYATWSNLTSANGTLIITNTSHDIDLETAGATSVFFSAYASSQTSNATGDGTAVTVPFDTAVYNVGAAYNAGTFTFTAPSDGFYAFYTAVSSIGYDTSHNSLVISYVGSTEIIIGDTVNPGVVYTYPSAIVNQSLSTIVAMPMGSTMTVQIVANGDTKTVGIYGAALPGYFTWFRGYRVV